LRYLEKGSKKEESYFVEGLAREKKEGRKQKVDIER